LVTLGSVIGIVLVISNGYGAAIDRNKISLGKSGADEPTEGWLTR
jgi:hypothetical protein